ncbi:Peptide chain release factor PrfB3, chloroplastic, partial [Frankliniella fusca]
LLQVKKINISGLKPSSQTCVGGCCAFGESFRKKRTPWRFCLVSVCQSFVHCHCFELGHIRGHNSNDEDFAIHFFSGECHQFVHTI